jgi:hypothetical protein
VGKAKVIDTPWGAAGTVAYPRRSSIRHSVGHALETVKRFGIMVLDALLGFPADLFELLECHNGVRIAGRIQMPIVRADDKAMLPGVLEDPGEVIVRLTGNIDLVRSENILRKLPAGRLVAVASFMVNPWYPLRGRFNKPPA